MLTKTGVLAPQSSGKWAFFSNDGQFRRECLFDEAYYLSQTGKLIPAEVADFEYGVEVMPYWHELWSVTDYDDSRMIGSLANNGGAYGDRTRRTYYCAKMPNGQWKVRVMYRQWSTSEFFQDDDGRYQRPEERMTFYLTNTEGQPTVTLWGIQHDDEGYPISTANAVLEQHSDETALEVALADAGTDISSPYTWDGRLEYESVTTVNRVTFSEAKLRLTRLAEIGLPRPRKTKLSRRNTRQNIRR